jgi:transglutaminase-like putative cysteine protease
MSGPSPTPSRRRYSPPQGWLTLVLLCLLALIVGWSIDEARWVPGPESITDFLPWAGVGGVLAGFVIALLGWPRLWAHLAGAIAAVAIVPVLVGSVLLPQEGNFFTLWQATADAAGQAIIDLLVLRRGTTSQYGHSLLVSGLFLWATGQFAAYAVFHHGRSLPAILSLGAILLVNVSLTPIDEGRQYLFLVVFSLGALLLLVRMHAVEERAEWARRRIGDPGPLASLTLRGGTVFVALAVFASLTLTSAAKSAPLQQVWLDAGFQQQLIDMGRSIQEWFPWLGSSRGPTGLSFGARAAVPLQWRPDDSIQVQITREAGDVTPYYWRGATYDAFDGQDWGVSAVFDAVRGADEDLLAETREAGAIAIGREVTVAVSGFNYKGPQILSPGVPLRTDTSTVVHLDAAAGGSILSVREDVTTYRITGIDVRRNDPDDERTVTISELRAAGRDYLGSGLTEDELSRYTAIPGGRLGADAERLYDEILTITGPDPTPFDLATAIETLMHDSTEFRYDTDVSDAGCGTRDVVECFAYAREGFCMYYASTMAMLMRNAEVPTRFVQGLLPGERSGAVETVSGSSAHAWVEVWFPGIGWYPFDPTGGDISELVTPPLGIPVPSPSAAIRPSDDPEGPDRSGASIPASSPIAPIDGTRDLGPLPFIIIALILAAAMGTLALTAYRRGPREVTADSAWGSVTRMARRLGFGPRPTQTVYEYSAELADVLPSARPELQTVARAKVEVAYGARSLSADRVRAVRAATGRLRIALLGLVFRRGRRRRRRSA